MTDSRLPKETRRELAFCAIAIIGVLLAFAIRIFNWTDEIGLRVAFIVFIVATMILVPWMIGREDARR